MQYRTLLELNNLIKTTLDTQLAPSYWVVAEISELRVAQKGHCYLELVEKENNFLQAKLRATIWASAYRNINGWFEAITGQSLQPGMKVLANIRIEFHELYGLSANIKDIDPKFTLGERARRKQEIIDKLIADGIFEMNKQLPLPEVPQKIALISSPSAAGYGDFMDQLQNNDHGYVFSVDLHPSIMQGCDAPPAIIKALHTIFHRIEDYDLVAIIRGGGAQVDMDCFDDYDLASHIAQFPIPVVTGIGHERDESIADLVAHSKFKTPTAVSAYLIATLASFEQKLDFLTKRMDTMARNYCTVQNHMLSDFSKFMEYHKSRFWEKEMARLEQLQYKVQVHAKRALEVYKGGLTQTVDKIKTLTKAFVQTENQKIDYLSNTLKLSDPELILKKGYTISYIDHTLIKDAEIEPGKTLITRSEKTTIKSIIKSKSENKNDK